MHRDIRNGDRGAYEAKDYYHNIIIGKAFDKARAIAWSTIVMDRDIQELKAEQREKDLNKKKEPDEMSVAAGMPGVSTPLGTGPTYPAKIVKKNKKRQKRK